MGEYAEKNDRRIKLGTCEDLMYVTRQDVMALQQSGWHGDGGNYDLCTYLRGPFRFRLPDYDPGSPGDAHAIDGRKPDGPEFAIDVSRELIDDLRGKVDHGRMYFNKCGTNFQLPCPCGPDWAKAEPIIKCSALAYPRIFFCNEGAEPRRAVFRCQWCDHKFNLLGSPWIGEVIRNFETTWGVSGQRGLNYAYLLDLLNAPEPAVTA